MVWRDGEPLNRETPNAEEEVGDWLLEGDLQLGYTGKLSSVEFRVRPGGDTSHADVILRISETDAYVPGLGTVDFPEARLELSGGIITSMEVEHPPSRSRWKAWWYPAMPSPILTWYSKEDRIRILDDTWELNYAGGDWTWHLGERGRLIDDSEEDSGFSLVSADDDRSSGLIDASRLSGVGKGHVAQEERRSMDHLMEIYRELSAPVDFPTESSVEEQEIWMDRVELCAHVAGLLHSVANGATATAPPELQELSTRAAALGLEADSPEVRGILALSSARRR